MNVELKDGERIEDLDFNNLRIIQSPQGYCFTSDSVLLANFVQVGSKEEVIDLCSGSGIIGILLSAKTKAKKITLVELQERLFEMSLRSISLNDLEDRITAVNQDVKDVHKVLGFEKADVICCNPPYFKLSDGKTRENPEVAIARHEVSLNLEELLNSVNRLLKFGGRFYIVYTSDRLSELLVELSKRKLEPKKLLIISDNGKDSDSVLVMAKKGAEKGIRVKTAFRTDAEKDYSSLKW